MTLRARVILFLGIALMCSACASTSGIESDLKVQFVHAQTLEPMPDVLAGLQWMDNKTGYCRKGALHVSDGQGRVYFPRVKGAYRRPMSALKIGFQMIDRELDPRNPDGDQEVHRLDYQRIDQPWHRAWERMVADLGYEKHDRGGLSSLWYVRPIPTDPNRNAGGYETIYLLPMSISGFGAAQYYTRVTGPCAFPTKDKKTGVTTGVIDRSEFSEALEARLKHERGMAQLSLFCEDRWDGVFKEYDWLQFSNLFQLFGKDDSVDLSRRQTLFMEKWNRMKSAIPSYDGRYTPRAFTSGERLQFCVWVKQEIQNENQ